jgi:hypothetical protein
MPRPEYSWVVLGRDVSVEWFHGDGTSAKTIVIPAGEIGTIVIAHAPPHVGLYEVEFGGPFETVATVGENDLAPTTHGERLISAGRAADTDPGENLSHLTPEQIVDKLSGKV